MSDKKINDGGPAFPCDVQVEDNNGSHYEEHYGLTMRDWFAGQALAGLLPKLPLIDQTGEFGIKVADKTAYNMDVAESCYGFADAMLAARERK